MTPLRSEQPPGLSNTPCLSMQRSCSFCLISWHGPFLCPEQAIFENQPDLLVPSSLQGCIPWGSSKQVPQQACSPEVQVWNIPFLPHLFLWGWCITSSLQPRLLPTFSSSASSSLLIRKASKGLALVGSLITCVRNLLSMHSRNLLLTFFYGSISFRCLYI